MKRSRWAAGQISNCPPAAVASITSSDAQNTAAGFCVNLLETRAMDYKFLILHRQSGFYVSIRHKNGQVLQGSQKVVQGWRGSMNMLT